MNLIWRIVFLACLIIPSLSHAADVPHIQVTPFLTGLKYPTSLTDDGSGRLFITEQDGAVRLVENGVLQSQPFLDLTEHVSHDGTEHGLKCVVFHPQFAKNGRLFVNYVSERSGHTEVIVSEFKADPSAKTADPASERVIWRYAWPLLDHFGGQLAFGPDGMLYIGNGDGGPQKDPNNCGQRLDTLFGKMLRLDVDHKQPYAIPADNPFVNRAGALPEIWAYGLRNPWRFSFDSQTHQLYCGDVGQDTWEEVDLIEKGGNYGWSAREGKHDFVPERANGKWIDPIKDYGRRDADGNFLGVSVTGGYVYRGKKLPALDGIYVYGDFQTGRIWGLKWDGKALTFDAELAHPDVHISSFGEDKEGELYVLDYYAGNVERITP
jgi:glucose/arabinose dehydrogenase